MGMVRSIAVGSAVFVMVNVVLSQQSILRELPIGRFRADDGGAHLQEQVQEPVPHGTCGSDLILPQLEMVTARSR